MKQLFELGEIAITPGIEKKLRTEDIDIEDINIALERHMNGDWGDLSDEDIKANNQGLNGSDSLYSDYTSKKGTNFWIITEWDRSATTFLLPEEY